MFSSLRPPVATSLALALACTLGCTVDKGDDSAEGSDPGTDSASSSPSTGEQPTSGGQTTGIDGDDGTTSGTTGETGGNTPCIDTPTVLASDEASPLGFSAEALLDGKLGARQSTLKFASEPTTLREDLKGLEMLLTVELRYEGGEVRYIDSEVNPDYDDSGNESGFPGECTDRLEVDLEIDFMTMASELAEHRKATLVATTLERATVDVQLLPPGLMGSLDPATIYQPSDPAWTVTQIFISGTWDGALAGGSLLNEVLVGDEQDGFAGFGPIASWGDPIP